MSENPFESPAEIRGIMLLSWLTTRLSALGVPHHSPPISAAASDARRRAADELTPAQREVYELLLSGAPTRAIAEQLGRSEFTVRNHIKAIFKKLKVNSRAMLLSTALSRVGPLESLS